ncbi:MAG: GNAT family N-acetyltransferase [Clostridia bacterium]|nr:GNAT family N-acetyltransferase [Clostridia bacterium]
MIRIIRKEDREEYLSMVSAFYASDVVLAPIPRENMEKTFDLLLAGTPYAQGYIFEVEGNVAGYALLARTWSQEAGGEAIWIEELYCKSEYRGMGLGSEFFTFLEAEYPEARRLRLEVEEENEGAVRLYERKGFSWFDYKQMKKDF